MSEALAVAEDRDEGPVPRFCATTSLMPHQEAAVAKLLPSRANALFMEMGTGKSRTLIELARIRQSKWDRLFWFCPVSLKETVRQELMRHTDLPPDAVCVFNLRTTEANVSRAATVYVVGIESMAAGSRVVLAVNGLVTDRSFVAVDESSYIKGHKALRTQRITRIAERARYRTILTGTPFTQGVVDLFGQMNFLSPRILGYRSFHAFAANHLVYETRTNRTTGQVIQTDRIVYTLGHDVLAERMAPYVYQVRKGECLTLPDKLHEAMACEMTPGQRKLHEQAKEDFLLRREPDDWSPVELFRLFTALQTIACGWWRRTYPDTGESEVLRAPHGRLDLLDAAIGEIAPDEKVVVWTKYRDALSDIVARLTTAHGPGQVARYDGGLTESQRNAELVRWRTGARFLVATQAAGGHGLTLNEAAHAVFYADGYKYSERIQAEDRQHRIGQTRSPTYVTLRCSGSIDDRIQDALARKGNALRSFMREVDQVRATGTRDKVLELVRRL